MCVHVMLPCSAHSNVLCNRVHLYSMAGRLLNQTWIKMKMRQDDSPIAHPPLTAKELKLLSILKIWRATYGKSGITNDMHVCKHKLLSLCEFVL